MKPFLAAIDSGLNECFANLKRTLDGLNEDELNFRPTLESNTINWMVWHMARVEDNWINRAMRRSATIWDNDGWGKKLGIDVEGNGYSQTAEDIRAFPRVDVAVLLDYYSDVRQATTAFFESLEDVDALQNVVTHPSGDPSRNVTWQWVLGHLLCEEAQHQGQISYIRGMMRGLNQ